MFDCVAGGKGRRSMVVQLAFVVGNVMVDDSGGSGRGGLVGDGNRDIGVRGWRWGRGGVGARVGS